MRICAICGSFRRRVWQGCHTLLICAYPCLSVGGFLCQKVLCVPRVLWEHSFCLLCLCSRGSCTSVVVFSHGFHGFPQKLGCVIGGVGMAGCHTLLICAYLCLSVGGFLCQKVLCVSVSICGRLSLPEGSVCSAYSVGTLSPSALLVHLRQVHPLRVPPESAPSAIGLRPPPNQIASAVQSDCVRRPIRLRSPSDRIASAARCHK